MPAPRVVNLGGLRIVAGLGDDGAGMQATIPGREDGIARFNIEELGEALRILHPQAMRPGGSVRDKIPDGGIVNAEVQVAQFIHPVSGQLCWSTWYDGHAPMSSIVGLMVMGALDLARREPGDD